MTRKKSSVAIVLGVVLLFSGVAFSQPVFTPPANLGPPINTAFHESDPFLTTDGKRLFFVRRAEIWFAERSDTGWTNPVKLNSQINTGIGIAQSPSLSPDGQKLYFVADARQGFYWDIWVSTFDSSINDWGIPVNLGWPVNTAGAEFSAHLAPDGRRLFFTSEGFSRCGIYMSEWNGTDWSTPQLQWGCGTPEYPSVTADGSWLFFDQYVSDGKSIFVAGWNGSGWVLPAYDLRAQLGGRTSTPFITPFGDTLFFTGCDDFPGFGGCDIWMASRPRLGDLNIDGQLTAADVVLEVNWVFLEEPYPAPPELGDLNCDGRFSAADIVLLLDCTFCGTCPPPLPGTAACDLNCDGKLSGADIVLLVYRIFLQSPFPCSFAPENNWLNLG